METNLNCLQSFFHFLTHYPPEEKIYESAISLSSIIVDRFDIVRKIFLLLAPSQNLASGGGSFILGSLLGMLRKAMEMAIHSQTMPQLSSSEEFLLVSFPTVGKKTIIHTSLIQAIMLLLTFDLPPVADPSDYKYFLDQWFPVQEENRPEAHAVESKEKASFPHPSILPYMLLSKNHRILSASVSSSTPSQLCSFVKHFGCPLAAVEKVLESLDAFCEDHDFTNEMRRCVHDPLEMCRYVEVHMLRGATSGKAFLSFLQSVASVPSINEIQTSISSVLENEIPSPPMFGLSSHQAPPLSSSTAPPTRRGGSQMYTKLTSNSQEELERTFQQCFSTTHGKKGPSSVKSQQAASDLVSALKHCTSVCISGSNLGGGASSVGGASAVKGGAFEVMESFVGGLIRGLSKQLSGNKTRKNVTDGMIQSKHAISVLRLITKIVLNLSKNGRKSCLSLYQNTVQHLLETLESLTPSSPTNKFTVFRAAVTSCAKQLGVKHVQPLGSTTSTHKLTTAVDKACKEIEEAKDPFKNKTSFVKLCQGLTKAGLPARLEQLLSCVAKRAVSLGREQQCIQFLSAVRYGTSDSTLPIVLKFFPSYFTVRGEEDGELASRSQSPEDEAMETNGVMVVDKTSTEYWQGGGRVDIDVCGITVDWLELLDPEMVSLCPELSMRMVFGSSNTEQLSSILATTQREEKPSGQTFVSPSSPRISSSLLLSGQGYLQNRLTNCSSWSTLFDTMSALLSSEQAKEW